MIAKRRPGRSSSPSNPKCDYFRKTGARSRLRQEELAKAYASSRMPVREALRTLNVEGLVQFHPNRGAVVSPVDPFELHENYEMRDVSEGLAIRLAIPQLSNAQIDKAAAIQRQIDSCHIDEFGALNKEFHLTLYEPCRRPRLISHISTLHDIAERYLRFTIMTFNYYSRSSEEHRELVDSCYQRNVDRAVSITSSHIIEAGRTWSNS